MGAGVSLSHPRNGFPVGLSLEISDSFVVLIAGADLAIDLPAALKVTLLLPVSGSMLNGPAPVKKSLVNGPVPVKGYLGIFASEHGLDGEISRSTYYWSSCSGPERTFCVPSIQVDLGLVFPLFQADLCAARAKSDTGASILPVCASIVHQLPVNIGFGDVDIAVSEGFSSDQRGSNADLVESERRERRDPMKGSSWASNVGANSDEDESAGISFIADSDAVSTNDNAFNAGCGMDAANEDFKWFSVVSPQNYRVLFRQAQFRSDLIMGSDLMTSIPEVYPLSLSGPNAKLGFHYQKGKWVVYNGTGAGKDESRAVFLVLFPTSSDKEWIGLFGDKVDAANTNPNPPFFGLVSYWCLINFRRSVLGLLLVPGLCGAGFLCPGVSCVCSGCSDGLLGCPVCGLLLLYCC